MTHKSSVLCIDRQGKRWQRHCWDCYTNTCARCAVDKREWDKTRARRRAGELLVGERGAIVKLNGATVEREQGGGE